VDVVKRLSDSMGFIVFFLILVLGVSMLFGDQVAVMFLVLVLVGMLVTNSDQVISLMGRFSRG